MRAVLACVLVLGCSEPAPAPRWLVLEQIRPESRAGVYLNERLVLHFSEPLDPTSVHPQSVRITASDGTPARGELVVDDEELVFEPAPVLAFDLSDGGYRPGETYVVALGGFPRPDGLRGRSGAPLASNLQWTFRTVAVAEPRSGFVFEDASLGRGLPAILRTPEVAPGEPIVLEGEEPLDPSTLFAADFVLRRKLIEEQARDSVRPPLGEPIPLRARVVENFDKRAPFARGTARIELTPADRLLEPGDYYLQTLEDLRLRDFGGNPVRVRTPPPQLAAKLEVTVVDRAGGAEDVSSRFIEHFVDASFRSPTQIEGADGTAWWKDSGRVEVRWPAAAGTGADRSVSLGRREPRRDLHAVKIDLAEGARCELDPAPGLVVLRAQGKIEISGTLVRHDLDAAIDPGAEKLEGQLFIDDPKSDLDAPLDVGAALEQARDQGLGLTALVAGGDLVIRGRIECSGTLLLVAGGRIRALTARPLVARRVYFVDAGTSRLDVFDAEGGQASAAFAIRLRLDPPQLNPLVEPLRFAVMSAPIPREGGALRWHVGPRIGMHAGAGSVRVRYIGERSSRPDGAEREIVVDDPGALDDCPTLRLLIELEVVPGARWDPPWVDFVELGLDRAGVRRGR